MRANRSALLLGLLLLSVALNGVALVHWLWPGTGLSKVWLHEGDEKSVLFFGKSERSLATAEAEANFTVGLARFLRGEPSLCAALGGRSYFFCMEGESFARAIPFIAQPLNPFDQKKLIGERGEEQMGLGMALSCGNPERVREFISNAPNARHQKYLVDGWAFGVAMRNGAATALRACEKELTGVMLKYCVWGVGRSLWFSGQDLPRVAAELKAPLGAGNVFARRFAGDKAALEESERAQSWGFASLSLAELLMGKRPSHPVSKTIGQCLANYHLYDCITGADGAVQ